MPRFFNRIRKQLAKENKFFQYSRYAIGEILLVVVGILIALQLDAWNENRKDDITEKKHLEEILVSLNRDFGRTKGIYNGRAIRKKEAVQDLMNYLNNDSVVPDSVLYQTFLQASMSLSFTFDKGAYESLKAYGLDKISNDSLRPTLVRFYEVSLPLAIIFIDDERDVYKARQAELHEQLWSFSYVQQEDSNWHLDLDIDFSTVKDKEAFKELMYMEGYVAENYVRRLESAMRRIKSMISLVEIEISPN